MQEITFVTGNPNKLQGARAILEPLGITVTQQTLDIPEVQDEDGEVIARDKAQKAYDLLKKPVVITDDSWHIAGLHGFPGPYMKSINHWFSVDDFLHLTQPLTDRRVALHQHLVYQDEHGQQYFMADIPGTLQTEARGNIEHEPAACIISLQEDGKTIAEIRDSGASAITQVRSSWHILAEWLESNPR